MLIMSGIAYISHKRGEKQCYLIKWGFCDCEEVNIAFNIGDEQDTKDGLIKRADFSLDLLEMQVRIKILKGPIARSYVWEENNKFKNKRWKNSPQGCCAAVF